MTRIFGLFLLALILIGLGWRWASRRRSLPCPTWLAATLTSSLMDKLAGTQTTLDRLGLQPGQRVLEVGPGPGRLLIPASRRVWPGGDVVGLDIQPGMLERLNARTARAGVSNLTAVLGDATQSHFSPASLTLWLTFCLNPARMSTGLAPMTSALAAPAYYLTEPNVSNLTDCHPIRRFNLMGRNNGLGQGLRAATMMMEQVSQACASTSMVLLLK